MAPLVSLEVGLTLSFGNYQSGKINIQIGNIDTSKPIEEQLQEVKNVFPKIWDVVVNKVDESFDNLEKEFKLKTEKRI